MLIKVSMTVIYALLNVILDDNARATLTLEEKQFLSGVEEDVNNFAVSRHELAFEGQMLLDADKANRLVQLAEAEHALIADQSYAPEVRRYIDRLKEAGQVLIAA